MMKLHADFMFMVSFLMPSWMVALPEYHFLVRGEQQERKKVSVGNRVALIPTTI